MTKISGVLKVKEEEFCMAQAKFSSKKAPNVEKILGDSLRWLLSCSILYMKSRTFLTAGKNP